MSAQPRKILIKADNDLFWKPFTMTENRQIPKNKAISFFSLNVLLGVSNIEAMNSMIEAIWKKTSSNLYHPTPIQ